jgi:L-alanine-DL-glutamate epimerase-like enolase superfamily enzyme
MKLSYEQLVVHTANPFVIARGGASEYTRVRVRLVDADGVEGLGEAAPSAFYGENAQTVVSALEQLRPVIEAADAWALDDLEHALQRALHGNASARMAVSGAAHDIAGKRLGVPLYKLWGLTPANAPRSSFTIAIAPTAAELVQRVEQASAYPILKVKLGTDRDDEIVRTVRGAAPDKTLRVDANAAWTAKHALAIIERLAGYGVEFVEQPLPAEDIDGLLFVRERSALPIIADESCVTSADIPRLVGAVDGINIKLAKCGGLREAHRMIAAARTHGMRVMMGCMIETSLGITAAAHLAPLLDYADLDGAALLSDDPHAGATIAQGRIAIPEAPGLGVRIRTP